ncbi:MAG: GNAT family N-acetyltransferase [Candidatus Levyibacteriota bacterium]
MIIIRTAKDTDYQQIVKLYNDFVGEDRYSKKDNDSFHKVLRSRSNFIFVAQDKNNLVGFATFSIRNVTRYKRPIAELDEMYVDTNYRGKGIGKRLMSEVEKQAKKLNCYRLYIESQYKHTLGHKLYESLGYKNYGYHFFKNL